MFSFSFFKNEIVLYLISENYDADMI
jgi:hypothetical protein